MRRELRMAGKFTLKSFSYGEDGIEEEPREEGNAMRRSEGFVSLVVVSRQQRVSSAN